MVGDRYAGWDRLAGNHDDPSFGLLRDQGRYAAQDQPAEQATAMRAKDDDAVVMAPHTVFDGKNCHHIEINSRSISKACRYHDTMATRCLIIIGIVNSRGVTDTYEDGLH